MYICTLYETVGFYFCIFSHPEDLSRDFLRVECSVRNYPPIYNTVELAKGIFVNPSLSIDVVVCKNSIIFSGSYTGFLQIY